MTLRSTIVAETAAADHRQLLSTVWAELFSGFIFTRLFTAWRFLKQFGDNHQLTHLKLLKRQENFFMKDERWSFRFLNRPWNSVTFGRKVDKFGY